MPGQRKWPIWWAPFAVMVRPIATVRYTEHARLWQAWLVHAAGIVLWLASLAVSAVVADYWHRANALPYMFEELREIVEEAVGFALTPLGAAMVITWAICIEAATVITAWACMAWTARNERVKDTFARSLKRVWLLTGFNVTAVVAGFIIGEAGDESPSFGVFLAVVFTAITLTLLLRAMAVGRTQRCSRWPASCEGCGYALVGVRMDQACPECGRPVSASLDDDVRPGSAWDRASRGGWLKTTADALLRPTALGQTLRVMTLTKRRNQALAINLALIWLVGPIGMITIMIAGSIIFDGSIDDDLDMFMFAIGGSYGLVYMGLCLAGVLLGGSVVGSLVSYRAGRNLLPAAGQAAVYAAPWFIIGAAGVIVMIIAIMWLVKAGALDFLETSPYLGIVMSVIGFGPPLAIGGVYLWLVGRITWAARFASR